MTKQRGSILIPVLVTIAILLIAVAIVAPKVIASRDKAERMKHPEEFATSWMLVRSEELSEDNSVVFYKDKKSGSEIACVYGRLASAPSCFLTGNKI